MSSDDYFDTKDYPDIDDFADSDLASKFDNLSVTKKKSFQDGFKKFKTVNQVLDKSTMFTMYEMINAKIIAYVNGIVRAGKESVLFWAVDKEGVDVALKVYLVSTTSFKKRAQYVVGDPRFSRIKSGTKNMVYLWAKKEFRNLQVCYKKGIPTVRPIHVSKNVLAMEFIGKNGVPSPTLHETNVDENDYVQAMDIMTRLYRDVHLVHGDFSEYNVFKTEKGLILFDMGSAVDTMHPNAQNFLERDIKNMSYFFAKRGLTVQNPADVLAKMMS